MIYQKDSSKAEEFIHHEEILDTLFHPAGEDE